MGLIPGLGVGVAQLHVQLVNQFLLLDFFEGVGVQVVGHHLTHVSDLSGHASHRSVKLTELPDVFLLHRKLLRNFLSSRLLEVDFSFKLECSVLWVEKKLMFQFVQDLAVLDLLGKRLGRRLYDK